MPSWPIEMPSETEMVPNSIGKPPAACTPSLAAFASRSSDRLQGVISFQLRRHADLRLGEVLVAHADRAQHAAGGGPLQTVGDVAAARLDVGCVAHVRTLGEKACPGRGRHRSASGSSRPDRRRIVRSRIRPAGSVTVTSAPTALGGDGPGATRPTTPSAPICQVRTGWPALR